MALVLAFITGILGIIFAASLMDHYLVKRRQYHLLWAIGFGLFFLGMLFWVLREGLGQSELLYSLWFVTGGVLVPAYFGSGMISLMFPQLTEGTIGGVEGGLKKADAFLGTIVGISVIFLILALVAPISAPSGVCPAPGIEGLDCLLPSQTLTKAEFFPIWLRAMGIIIVIYGGLALLAGAIWGVVQLVRQENEAGGGAASGTTTDEGMPAEPNILRNTVLGFKLLWRNKDFWKRDLQAQRSYSNLIVLGGAVLAALSLTMNSVEGSSTHVLLFLLAGIAIYGGFLANKEVMETSPSDQLRESLDAAKSMRGAPSATLAPEAAPVTTETPLAQAPPEPEATEAVAPDAAPTAEADAAPPEAAEPEQAASEEPIAEVQDEERPSAVVEEAPEPTDEEAPSDVEESDQEPGTEEPSSDTEEESRPS